MPFKKAGGTLRVLLNTIDGWLYGAGNEKLGAIIGKGAKAGGELKNKLLKNIPALGDLINRVRGFVERSGYIPGIDGRPIFIRSFEGRYLLHTALNALLQGSGSIVVKRGIVIANKEICKRCLDAQQVIFYHDEVQYDCLEEHANEVGEILRESFIKAGEYYKLRIPLDGEFKVGSNWAETH